MKKMITCIASAFLLTIGLHAQDPFYPTKEGISLTYVEKSGKGKVNGYSQMSVTAVSVTDENNLSITTASQSMDEKKKELFSQPITMTVHIRNGVVQFDPASMAGKLMEGISITGDSFMLPADASVGMALNDYNVTVNMGAIKNTTSFTNVKVSGKETLNVGGKAIECLIVENEASTKVMGIKQQSTQKTWFARNIGQVKMEMYNKKGKLMSIQELIEVTEP